MSLTALVLSVFVHMENPNPACDPDSCDPLNPEISEEEFATPQGKLMHYRAEFDDAFCNMYQEQYRGAMALKLFGFVKPGWEE